MTGLAVLVTAVVASSLAWMSYLVAAANGLVRYPRGAWTLPVTLVAALVAGTAVGAGLVGWSR